MFCNLFSLIVYVHIKSCLKTWSCEKMQLVVCKDVTGKFISDCTCMKIQNYVVLQVAKWHRLSNNQFAKAKPFIQLVTFLEVPHNAGKSNTTDNTSTKGIQSTL